MNRLGSLLSVEVRCQDLANVAEKKSKAGGIHRKTTKIITCLEGLSYRERLQPCLLSLLSNSKGWTT